MEVEPFVATVPDRSCEAAALEDPEEADAEASLEAAAELEDPQAANIVAAVVIAAITAITCFFFMSYILHQMCNLIDSTYVTEKM
jgi:competence transcription factor ComK